MEKYGEHTHIYINKIYAYIYIYKYKYIYIYLYLYIYAYILYLYIYIYLHIYIYISYICIHTHVFISTHIYTWKYDFQQGSIKAKYGTRVKASSTRQQVLLLGRGGLVGWSIEGLPGSSQKSPGHYDLYTVHRPLKMIRIILYYIYVYISILMSTINTIMFNLCSLIY